MNKVIAELKQFLKQETATMESAIKDGITASERDDWLAEIEAIKTAIALYSEHAERNSILSNLEKRAVQYSKDNNK